MKVLIEDLSSHPHCAHGPTLLFRRTFDSSDRFEDFFACSACRNRKECSFYSKKEGDGREQGPWRKKDDSSVEDSLNENDTLRKVNRMGSLVWQMHLQQLCITVFDNKFRAHLK